MRRALRRLAAPAAFGLLAVLAAGQAQAQTPTPPWTVSLTGPTTITEGETADYVVTLSEPHDHGIHVRLIVDVNLGRTATASAGLNSNDWGSLSHTGAERRGTHTRASLRFVGGATTSTLHVPITDDMVAELSSDESLLVSLNVRGWTAAGYFNLGNPRPSVSTTAGSVTTVISDPTSDGLVSLVGPIDAIAMDATGAARNAVFTVRVTGTTTGDVTVAYSVGATGDDATRVAMSSDAGADYVSPATGSLPIPMGANPTATISIPTVTPLSSESSEFFTVTLTTVSGGGAGFTPMLGAMDAPTRSAIASIAGQPITITAARNGPANTRYNEGQSITFTLTLSGPQPLSDIFVPWQISRFGTNLNSNPEPEDFGFVTLRQERRITLAEMAAARRTQNPDPITIVVNNVEDDLWDNNFTKLLSFEFPADAPPRGGGLGPIATAGSANDRFFIIAASPAPITLELTARDVTEDGGEQIAWTFQLKQHGRLLRNPMRIGPTIWVSYTQTGTATRGDATDAMDYLLNPDVDDVTRQNNGFDTPTAGRFQWAPATPGAAYQGTILITPTDDSTYGGDKTVTMTLSNFLSTCSSGNTCPSAYNFAGLNAGETMFSTAAASASATLRIIDDEPQLSLAAPDPATVAEGGALTYTVTLRNPPASGSITVDYAVAADSDDDTENAAAGDFDDNNDGTANTAFPSGTLTFAQGETSKEITLQTIVDGAAEDAEVFVLTLSNAGPSSANVGIDANATSATGTINANTAISRTLTLSAAATSVAEGGSLTYTVNLTGNAPASGDDLAVSWAVSADSDADTNDAAAGDFDDDNDGTANTAFPSGSVTFTSADVADKTFSVQTFENTVSETGRVYVVTISVTAGDGGGSNTLAMETHTATITDDDPLTAALTLSDDSLVEGTDTTAAFGVELSGAAGVTLGDDVTATFEIANTSTATGGAGTVTTRDYTTPSAFTVTVASGSSSAPISIALNDDGLNEGPETLIVRLTAVSGANVALSATPADLTMTATIAANDPTTVAVAGPSANVSEGSNATFTLTFAGGTPSEDVTLPYTITGVTAGDLSGGAQLMTIESIALATITGATPQSPVTFSIGIASDGVVEAQETLTLTLDNTMDSSPGGGGGGGINIASAADSDNATVTIPANDAAVVSIAAVAASVGEGGTSAQVEFEFGLVDASDNTMARTAPAAVTVNYTLSGAAAGGASTDADRDYTQPASDFTASTSSGVFTLPAASSTARLALPINNDILNEPDETIIITLTMAGGGGGGTIGLAAGDAAKTATASIADDDDLAVYLTRAATGAVTEGSSATFTVSLRRAHASDRPLRTSTGAVCVPFSVEVTGQQTTSPAAANDSTSGPDIALVSPNDGTCADRGTAASVADSNGAATASVIIPAGQSVVTFQILARFDEIDEGATAESLEVTLGTPVAGSDAGSVIHDNATVSVDIANLNAARTLSVAATTASAEEGGNLVFEISVIGAAVSEDFDVTWTVTGATADIDSANVDGAASAMATTGTASFTAGASPQTRILTLVAEDDATDEMDETVTVTITDPCPTMGVCAVGGRPTGLPANAPSLEITGDSAEGTITESDHPVTLSIAAPSADLAEGTASTLEVSFSESVTTTEPVTADWTITFPAASATVNPAESADFNTLTGDVTIPAGMSSANISLTASDDAVNEALETFTVTLSNPAGGGAIAAPVLHSTDEDTDANIAANDALVAHIALDSPATGGVDEGSSATFSVTLRTGTMATSALGTSGGIVCVPFTTSVTSQQTTSPSAANDATSGADIALLAPNNGACADRTTAASVAAANGAATASVLIPRGMSSAEFSVQALFDGINEGTTDESLEITLGTPVAQAGAGSATASSTAATVPINNINATRTLSVSATTASADEGGNLVFVIAVSGEDVSEAFNVTWTVTGATADIESADVDGTASASATTGSVAFTATTGAQSRTLTLAVLDDADDEAAETVTVTLTDPCPASPAVCSLGGRPMGTGPNTPTLRLTTASANGTIRESDRPVTLSIAAPAGDLVEGTALSFEVSFSESITTTAPVTADWTISYPAATETVNPAEAADFEVANRSGSISISTGQSSVELPITASNDAINEAAERFIVTLSNPAGGGAIAAPVLHATEDNAAANIAANDPLVAHLALTDPVSGRVEEDGFATFTVTLREGDSVTDDLATSAGIFCVPFSARVTGQQTASPAKANDADSGPDIALVDPDDGTCADRTTAAGIADVDGRATASMLVAAGSSTGTFRIRALFDNIDEGMTAETLSVTLGTPVARSSAGSATASSTAATVSIDNINAARALSIAATTASADEGGNLEFTVTISGTAALEEAVAVDWEVTAGADDVNAPTSGTLNFAIGALPQERTIMLAASDDTETEAAETVTVTITDPCPAMGVCAVGGRPSDLPAAAPALRLSTGSADGTIRTSDNPLALGLTAPDSDLTEGAAVVFLVGFGEAITTTAPVTVDWEITFPAASETVNPAAAADFAETSGSASIPAGAMTASIEITTNDDAVSEAAERFTLTLSNAAGGGPIAAPGLHQTNAEVAANIAASDAAVAHLALVSPDSGGVNEDTTATFSVTLRAGTAADSDTATSGGAVCLPFSVEVTGQQTTDPAAANDATSGADIALLAPNNATCADRTTAVSVALADGSATASVVITAGQESATFEIRALFDSIDEGDTAETLRVTLGTPVAMSGAGATTASATAATLPINNINAARTLSLAATTASAEEGGNLVFTATLSGAEVTEAFDVAWSITSGGEDVDGADSGTVRFTTGALPQDGVITLVVTDDALDEMAETVTLVITDPCPTDGSVCGVGGRPGTLADSAPALRLGNNTASGTIGASDRTVTLSLTAPSDVSEGAAATFTVSFSESVTTTAPLTVDWAVSFPAASAGVAPAAAADFAALRGDVSIRAGQSSVTFTITANADNLNEAVEQFSVTLSNAAGGGAIAVPVLHATDAAAALNIAASDPLTASIARGAGQSGDLSEGGDAQFTVSLALTGSAAAATSADDICVTFTTSVAQSSTLAPGASANTAQNPDIAVPGCDGSAVTVMADGSSNGGVTIPAGQSSASFVITARIDREDEGSDNEMLRVALAAATHNTFTDAAALTLSTTANSVSLGIVNSNALRTLSVAGPPRVVDEDSVSAANTSAMASFTVTMRGTASDTPVMVQWELSSPDGSLTLPAASGLGRGFNTADLGPGAARTGTVTFPANEQLPAEMLVNVPIAQDAMNEGIERLQLALGTVMDPSTSCTASCTQVVGVMAEAVVAASDDITIFLAPETDQGTLTTGESANYVMSFGTTTVNGQVVPIVPTTEIMVPVMVNVGGATTTITVTVNAGDATARVVVPATTVSPAGQTGTPMLTVAVGTPSGAPGSAMARPGTAADLDAQPESESVPKPRVATPGAQQVAGWELRITAGGAEAPEGEAYQVTFALDGNLQALSGLNIPWTITARPAGSGQRQAMPADFAASASTPPAYDCAPDATGACTIFPRSDSGVAFTSGVGRMVLAIQIRDDGDTGDGVTPDGFSLNLRPLAGADAGRTFVSDAPGATPLGALNLEIPALRADLRLANATGAEGANALFMVSLAAVGGGTIETTQDITVSYRVGVDAAGNLLPGDSATRGTDYLPGSGTATIVAGATPRAEIAIPLLRDGELELRETFTLFVTGTQGGSIRLVNAAGEEQPQISATGTITDDADQSERREQRVGTLVSVLDRQTAIMATDAIAERLSAARSAGGAQLAIANRNLLGSGAAGEQAGAQDIGLALYGAKGLGGADSNTFAGLGAGLAGGANIGQRTALPSLAELMNGSRFAFQASATGLNLGNLAEGVQIWGSGSAANLEGNPRGGSASLDYDGATIAAFIGADRPLRNNLLAGFALGWASGDLDFTDSAGAFTTEGELSNNMLSLHPYLNWQLTPNLNAWLVLGFGLGSLDITENEGSGADRVSRELKDGDSTMLMFSAGVAGQQQLGRNTDLKLRLKLTQVRSEIDNARFSDGARLTGARRSSGRLGGEAEVGHRFSFANGITLRPFGTLALRFQNDSTAASAESSIGEALDAGGGVSASWPEFGLEGRAKVSLQINGAGHEEQRASLHLNFDPGADSRGLTLAVQSDLSEQSGGLLHTASGHNRFATPLAGAAGGANQMERSISGELGYGMALRPFGRPGLLTPYGRFNLGSKDQRWAAGLRLANPYGLQLALEAGLDQHTPARNYDLLLTGRLRF